MQAAGRNHEACGGEDQQGPAALLPHRAAAQHQEGARPGEGRQERARAAARACIVSHSCLPACIGLSEAHEQAYGAVLCCEWVWQRACGRELV